MSIINLLGFVFFIISGLIFVALIRYIIITLKCSKWPVVVGEVISSERKARFEKLAQITESAHIIVGPYRPEIMYTYEVNGKNFTNDTVRPVGKNVWRGAGVAQRISNLYPKDSKVNVFYNPSDPKKSVLDPWMRFSPLAIGIPTAIIFLGLGFAFIGIGILIDLGITLISWALYASSALLMVHNIRYLIKVLKCQKWPNVEGEIEKVWIYGQFTRAHGYNVDVTYTYEVKGEKYTNNQRKLGYVQGTKTFIPKLFAMMKLEKYKEGKKVKVFYNPSNPNNSVLERGILPFTFSMMVIVAVSLFFMGLFGIPTMIYSILFP